jgi:translocation and assembly module TamB
LKVLAWFTLALVLLASLIMLLPFSATGSQVLLQWVSRSDLVDIKYTGGSLFGDLQLQRVVISTDSVNLRLSDLHTRLELGCFWRSRFCLSEMTASELTLDILPGESEPGSVTPDPQLMNIPYGVEVAQLQLGSVLLSWPGGSWRQGTMQAAINLAGSRLQIDNAAFERPLLIIDAEEAGDSGYAGFEPPQIFLPLELDLGQLRLVKPGARIGTVEQAFEQIEIAGSWNGSSLKLGELTIVAPGVGQLAAKGSVDFRADWPLQFEAQFEIEEELEQDLLKARQGRIELAGDLRSLQASLGSDGSPVVEVAGQANILAARLPFSLSAELAWPEGTLLGEAVTVGGPSADVLLTSPLQLELQGDLEKQAIELAAGASGLGYEALDVRAQARLEFPELRIDSLELVDAGSQSSATVTAVVGLDQNWSVRGDIDSEGFYLAPLVGNEPGRIHGSLSLLASGEAQAWRLQVSDVNLAGTVNGMPASVTGFAGVDSTQRVLPGVLRARVNGADLDLDASGKDGEEARLSLRLDDLGRWVPNARGAVELDLRGDLARRQLVFSGAMAGLQLDKLEIPELALSGSYQEDGQRLAASLEVPRLEYLGYALSNLNLGLEGTSGAHQLRLATDGDLSGAITVAGAMGQNSWTGTLQPARLDTGSGPWELRQDVQLAWAGEEGAVSLGAHCWQHSEFSLCLEDSKLGVQGQAVATLNGNVKAFNGLLPNGLRARGKLSSRLALSWQPGEFPGVDGTASARNVRITRRYGMGQRVTSDWQTVDLTLKSQETGLALTGEVVRGGRKVLRLDALLPKDSGGDLEGTLAMQELQLVTFSPWVTELSRLEGSLTGTLRLGGTVADPVATGSLHLVDGYLTAVGNPTELTELALDLNLDGDRGKLAGTGKLGGGEIRLEGEIVAKPLLRLEMTVSGERHQVLMPPASEMIVSEDLKLVLTDGLLDVTGEVRVHEGVLRHEELPAGSVALSGDVVLVDIHGNVIQEERPFEVRADIWLRIRERFQVKGDSVQATLGGDLHLVQVPGKPPQVFGSLNLVGGELRAFNQQLQIRRGTIAFSGPPDNPELNISAEREIRSDGVTVGARLQGDLEEPMLEVYSNPAMSQSEAMSYLVRGRGLDSGAGADGTALALSMGADVVNRSGIVTELNRLPLLSNVAFGASGEQDDTAATVSGYIGNRIYLSYGIGLYEPINVLTARLYLQSRLWLEVVSRLENSIDLYYSFDID